MSKASDILIADVRTGFADYAYRTPIKFGGRRLDRATVLDVAVRARNRNGKEAAGFGSMPMGNTWSFPSEVLPYDATLAAMKTLARRIANEFAPAVV